MVGESLKKNLIYFLTKYIKKRTLGSSGTSVLCIGCMVHKSQNGCHATGSLPFVNSEQVKDIPSQAWTGLQESKGLSFQKF